MSNAGAARVAAAAAPSAFSGLAYAIAAAQLNAFVLLLQQSLSLSEADLLQLRASITSEHTSDDEGF